MSTLRMDLWNSTTGYGSVGPRVEYLSDEQNCRAERIRVARMLFRGQHRQAFLTEGRTQFNFPISKLASGQIVRPYITFNVLRLISTTMTDLLLGEEPMVKMDDVEMPDGSDPIEELMDRSDVHRVFYDATLTASWAGEAMVEVVRFDREVYIQNVNPSECFPVGERQPDGQFGSFVRYRTAGVGNKTLLLETRYYPGRITRECFELVGTKKKGSVDLASWPGGENLLPEESTGIQWNTLVWTANELDEGKPTCDYDGLIDLQDELNAKQTQIARVIAKHADPKMAAPSASAEDKGNVSASHDLWFFRSKEEIPQYITWNAQLASAMEDRDFTLNAFCTAAELSAVLMGIKQGATPDAARKVRLEATKSLSRAKRKATFIKPFLKTAMTTAMMMEQAGRVTQVSMGGVGVDLRDGLPVDELDKASAISTYRAAGVMSVKRAVKEQLVDPAAVEEELAELAEEKAAATPPILLGGQGGIEPGQTDLTTKDTKGTNDAGDAGGANGF